MNNIEKAVAIPPSEPPVPPVEIAVPAKKNKIKSELRLLLLLAGIYSLIINQSQKINLPQPKESNSARTNSIKNEVSDKKEKASEYPAIIGNASFLMVKE